MKSTIEHAIRVADGRIVGEFAVVGNMVVLEKHIDASKHMMRSPRGFAIAETHLRRLAQLGGGDVVLIDKKRGCRWVAHVSAFFRHGRLIHFTRDRQILLEERYWRAETTDTRQLSLF